MITFVAIVHIIIALGLILFVLLQDPKGGAAGVFGGGGSGANSLFGATGAGNFLTATTKWLAILFAITCIALTYLSSHKTTSVMDEFAAPTVPQEGTVQPTPAASEALPENGGPGAADPQSAKGGIQTPESVTPPPVNPSSPTPPTETPAPTTK